jgi:hypothetical protein
VIYGGPFGTVRHVPPLVAADGVTVGVTNKGGIWRVAADDMNGDRRTDLLVVTGGELGGDQRAVEGGGYLMF